MTISRLPAHAYWLREIVAGAPSNDEVKSTKFDYLKTLRRMFSIRFPFWLICSHQLRWMFLLMTSTILTDNTFFQQYSKSMQSNICTSDAREERQDNINFSGRGKQLYQPEINSI
jgi:hypothetical protein